MPAQVYFLMVGELLVHEISGLVDLKTGLAYLKEAYDVWLKTPERNILFGARSCDFRQRTYAFSPTLILLQK